VLLSQVIGLDGRTSRVYKAVLDDPAADVPGLAAALGIQESEVSDALDALADSALLQPSRDNPGAFRIVDPCLALERALRQEEEDLAKRQRELDASKAHAAQILAEFERPGHMDTSGTYRSVRIIGLDAVQNEIETLSRGIRSQVCAVVPGGAQSAAALAAARPLDLDVLSRGVEMRTLYQDSVRNDPATLSYAKWLTEQGGQVRTATLLPPRSLIIDSRIALIPLRPSDTRAGVLRTEDPAVVENIVAMFEQAWDLSIPFGADPASDPTELTQTERDVLKLLSTGITDETASRRLGVSMRTVRRQMAALMERLDATSRFEAGIKAAHHGWLD
jgi:DNA-binding CsgD family transcriptional regulator/sugar-specific transcriptional regulator TrmB